MIFYQLLKRMIKYPTVFVITSVLACYLLFYMSESDFLKLKVSGILALVVLGVYFSKKLKARIVGHVHETMHDVWHFLVFILETILFLITGGYIGVVFTSKEEGFGFSEEFKLVWKAFLFQIPLFFIRTFVLCCCWPFMNMTGGRKVSWKDILIMAYGGLRGAIGLSLAMIVANSTVPEKFKDPLGLTLTNAEISYYYFQTATVIFCSVTIFFTVLFNGVTIKYLILGLNFIQRSALREKMKIMIKEKILIGSITKLEELKSYPNLYMADWDKVDEIMDLKS